MCVRESPGHGEEEEEVLEFSPFPAQPSSFPHSTDLHFSGNQLWAQGC